MTTNRKNRVQMTVSGMPGTGTITLLAASTGYQTFAAAYAADATVDVLIVDGTAWEVARDCTYTNSGTTLTRGTLERSSTGSVLSLTSAAIVAVNVSAASFARFDYAANAMTPGGRLTLETGVPVSATDQTAKTSVYYTPYVHNVINLWDGTNWIPTEFTEKTLALGTLTSGRPYDVFGYLSSGALVLESLVWTNDTTRATAVTLQDGRYCKSGDKTRLLLGTFYTTSTTTTEDSSEKRYLSNVHNRVDRLIVGPIGSSHTINNVTERNWNNGSGTLPTTRFISSLETHAVALQANGRVDANGSINVYLAAIFNGTNYSVLRIYDTSGNRVLDMKIPYFAFPIAGLNVAEIHEREYAVSTVTVSSGIMSGRISG